MLYIIGAYGACTVSVALGSPLPNRPAPYSTTHTAQYRYRCSGDTNTNTISILCARWLPYLG